MAVTTKSNMIKITKAILLAAGLGTRLRPLTLTTPKPLLKLDGMRLIDVGLNVLAKAGITDVAINVHYLGDQIRDYVGDGVRYGMRIQYSVETPKILDTGGGIRAAAALLGDGPFIALNSDALCAPDLAALAERHASSEASATMALKRLATGDTYQPVATDRDGWIRGLGGEGAHFYIGLQVLTQEFLNTLPPPGTKSCLIRDGYLPFIARGGKVASFIYEGYFNDVGTLERYEQAKKEVREGLIRTA